MPNFSFHRSSTPIPYSLGKPALNCCGGSLSTLGNMKRPVAASAAADAAEKAPHARPSHTRRVNKGEASSASRPAAAAAGFAVAARAAAPPGDAALVVFPARSGIGAAGALGAGAGRAAGAAPVFAAAAAVAASAAPSGVGLTCGVAAGFAPVGGALGTSGFVSSA